jgi:hypothetical protein
MSGQRLQPFPVLHHWITGTHLIIVKDNQMLTQAELKQMFHYDSATGVFTRFPNSRNKKHVKCNSYNKFGYLRIRIGDRQYAGHRLAWLYVYGKLPDDVIDHINGNKADNRIVNLRDCSRLQNKFNTGIIKTNTSGYTGVRFRQNYWLAEIRIHGKSRQIGKFATAEEASKCYNDYAKRLHGEFYREK